MYKPYTYAQRKIHAFIQQNFDLSHIALDPLSHDIIRVIDCTGEALCFAYRYSDRQVVGVPSPRSVPASDVEIYLKKAAPNLHFPSVHYLECITKWWNHTSTPFTLQQVLGFSDQLYLYFITRPIPDFFWVQNTIKKELITPEDKCGIDLWYFDGGFRDYKYGCVGNQGTCDRWEIRRMHTPMDGSCLSFCLLDPELGDCPPFDPLAILKEG